MEAINTLIEITILIYFFTLLILKWIPTKKISSKSLAPVLAPSMSRNQSRKLSTNENNARPVPPPIYLPKISHLIVHSSGRLTLPFVSPFACSRSASPLRKSFMGKLLKRNFSKCFIITSMMPSLTPITSRATLSPCIFNKPKTTKVKDCLIRDFRPKKIM